MYSLYMSYLIINGQMYHNFTYLRPTPQVELFHEQHVDQPTQEDFLQCKKGTCLEHVMSHNVM